MERRLSPLIGLIVNNHVPLDEDAAQAIKLVLDRHYKRVKPAPRKSK